MKPTTRRQFIRDTTVATTGILLGSRTRANADTPAPCSADAWKKHGIIIEATEPWEGRSVQNFTTRAEPLANGAWRIWYSASHDRASFTIAYAEGRPGEPMKKVRCECSPGDPADAPFALGNLPESWKPTQVTHLELPNGKHRLYFWVHAPQICRYLAAESDDGRRYRVIDPLRPVLYHPSDRATWGVPSPDGMMTRKERNTKRPPDEPLAIARQISNDATTIYQLPDGTFEMYSVALVPVPKGDPGYIAEDIAPGKIRVVDRYTSKNGIDFDQRQRVIQRDAEDPSDMQFYYLSSTSTPQGRVGLLGHYRCIAQTMDLEWCFSKDGVKWERTRRTAWLPRGNPPAPDCFGIYGGNQLVHHDGLWHLFYTGVNSSHNGRQSHGPARQVVMYATTPSIWA